MNRTRFFLSSAVRFCFLFIFGWIVSACSPKIFFGNQSQDQSVSESISYRKINPACSRMELSRPILDVNTFKKLVSCFNSNGAIEPIQRWVNRIEADDQRNHTQDLQAIVEFQNKYVLSQPRLIDQLNHTFHTLDRRDQLDPLLLQLGRWVENDEFISSTIRLFKTSYFGSSHQKLLKVFEEGSRQLIPSRIAQSLDLGLTLSQSRSFSSIQTYFKGGSFEGLLPLTQGFMEYLAEGPDSQHVYVGKRVIEAILKYDFLESMDRVLGVTPDELKNQVDRTTSVFNVLLKQEGRLFGNLTSLFHYLRKSPIVCLRGSKQVPDGVMHVIRELSEHHTLDPANYLKRNNKLTLLALKPFCDYPPELDRYYPAMEELADSSEIGPASHLLQALYQVQRITPQGNLTHPLAELVVDVLGDTGSTVLGTKIENSSGIKKLIPLLVQLNQLDDHGGVWNDLLLTASLLRMEDREQFKTVLDFLIRPLAELNGESVFDVLRETFAQIPSRDLAGFLWSLRGFINSDKELLGPVLTKFRTAYYANDVHPMLQLLRQVMADANTNEKFFDALFRVSETEEFRDVVQLISKMAQDHRLKDLMGAALGLFQKFGMEGKVEVHEGVEPVFEADAHRRHNLRASDLIGFRHELRSPREDWELACRQLDFGFNLADYDKPGYSQQISNVVSCLNHSDQYSNVEEAILFLRQNKTEDGRDYFQLFIDQVKSIGLSKSQVGFLVDRWMNSFDDGRFLKILSAVPYWVAPELKNQKTGSIAEPFLKIGKPLLSKEVRPALDRLQELSADVLRRSDFPLLLKYVKEIFERYPSSQSEIDPEKYDLDQIEQWIQEKECRHCDLRERALQVIEDYRHAVTGWDLIQDNLGKHVRKSWKYEDFSGQFKSLLDILMKPDAQGLKTYSGSKGRVFDALLRFTRYFSLQPGKKPNREQHYTSDHLIRWLRDRSNDHQLITFYYPGESEPRVRLVNSLDRLELVLIGADFTAPVLGTNFGLKFLADIADAWGDEDPSLWPEPIQRKARRGEQIRTLAEVVQEINQTQSRFEGLVSWLPGMASIRPQMYNIHQVISVLDENVKNGGLRVLRDLFYQIYYTNLKSNQSPTANDNHLKAILKMVRMGIFRQLGRTIKLVPDGDSALNDFFQTLIQGASQRSTRDIFDLLLVQDQQHELLMKVLEEVFQALEGESAQSFKEMIYYLVANTSSIELTDVVMNNLSVILKQYDLFLLKNIHVVQSVFTSQELSRLIRVLYEDQNLEAKNHLKALAQDTLSLSGPAIDSMRLIQALNENSEASQAWEEVQSRVKQLSELDDYKRLDLDQILKEILTFFEESSADSLARDTARNLRFYLARRLDEKDLDQFLILSVSQPEGTLGFLRTLGQEVENQDLVTFFAFIRRSIYNPK